MVEAGLSFVKYTILVKYTSSTDAGLPRAFLRSGLAKRLSHPLLLHVPVMARLGCHLTPRVPVSVGGA
jgi:hypothetical protein